MFDTNESLPSGYGYAGGDASQLASLASTEGALPSAYGTPKKAAEPAPSAPASYGAAQDPLAAFAQGVTTAVQQSNIAATTTGAFKTSGKAAAPAAPPEAPPAPSSTKWKVYAAIGVSVAAIGGTLWYLNRNKGM